MEFSRVLHFSPCELELYSHFRPHTHHNPICFTNFTINNPNSPLSVTDCTNGFQNFLTIRFQDLGLIKRPFKASNLPKHHKTLKKSVKPSRIKPLSHGVCRNSLKSEPTRRPRRVEQPFFLLRRISTVGLPVNLERSLSLSHSKNFIFGHCTFFPCSSPFWFVFEGRRPPLFKILSFPHLKQFL